MALPPLLLLMSLNYAYPVLIYVCFLLCRAIATCKFDKNALQVQHPRQGLIMALIFVAILTYVAQLSLTLVHWHSARKDTVISPLSCAMVYGLELATLYDTKKPAWSPYIGSFIIALVFDPVIAVSSMQFRLNNPPMVIKFLDITFSIIRFACLCLALAAYFKWRKAGSSETGIDSEQQSLLRKNVTGDSEDTLVTGYGTTNDTSDESNKTTETIAESEWERSERLAEESRDKRLQESGNWLVYTKGFKIFVPYIWPFHDKGLQFRAVLVGVCLLINNALNVLIPNQLGVVTKTLTDSTKPDTLVNPWKPWIEVLIFAGLKLSASEAGISLIRQRLWLPIEQYSEGAILKAAHSHILSLDAQFHDTKSHSDMIMAVQYGEAINSLLETICFRALPNLIDLGVAFVYLTVKFGPWEGFITISTTTAFLYLSTKAISRSRGIRQSFTNAWYEQWYIMNSGISGWTTVASFNQVPYEGQRFSAKVHDRISKARAYTLDYLKAQSIQYLVLLAGLLAGLFLAVWQVTWEHSIDASDFVVLLTYWSQLVSPLGFFANLGKTVSKNLIDAERLLEIMETKPKVVNKPNAPPFQFKAGLVEFDNVQFSYDNKKQILKNVSFSVSPGQTIAFVGQTGAGKSTILKLLDRFYDVTGGSINIDGQDVRKVDLSSLRDHIGVVPQNPVLFNDSVMDNVRYARLDATDEEVHNACKAAAIHDQILGFSDGYKTRVGERGMKLSGGELQRVAIARAILKQPKIVLLDEATSAIDTETEAKIQNALRRLCKNRTTFIVAHRLSTIVNADRIIVVSNGEILEQGNHDDLISAGGKYAELWSKQIFVTPKIVDSDDECDGQKSVSSERSLVGESRTEGATADNDGEQSGQVKTPSGHRKEGSRLNPDAPEFTPRSMLAATVANSPVGKTTTAGHDPFSQTLTPVLTQQPRIKAPVVSLPRPIVVAKTPSNLEDSNGSDDGPTAGSAKEGPQNETDRERQKRKFSYRIPRYTRRNQSRSEPSADNNGNTTGTC